LQAGPVAKVRLNADGRKKAFAFVEFDHLVGCTAVVLE
jgi:hypothetical protein